MPRHATMGCFTLALAVSLTAGACDPRPQAGEPAGASAAAVGAPATQPARPSVSPTTQPPGPGASPEAPPSPQVKALLQAMRRHAECNRIMGCEAAARLRAMGPAAIPPAVAAIRAASPKDEGWWLVELVRTLGALGREASPARQRQAREVLESLLMDPRDELRGRAALALARVADPSSRLPVKEALVHWRAKGDDPAVVGALLFALERTGRPSRALRRQFVALLPASEDQLGRVNAGALAILADVARAWDLPQASAGLRVVARHRARPARLAAVRALGALRDTGALGLLQARLDDQIPAIRRAAIRALQQITGNAAYGTADEWRAWWRRRSTPDAHPDAHPAAAPLERPDGGS